MMRVHVHRTNHVEDHVVEQNSGLKIDNLRSVSGKELFKNNQYLVPKHTCKHLHTPSALTPFYAIFGQFRKSRNNKNAPC